MGVLFCVSLAILAGWEVTRVCRSTHLLLQLCAPREGVSQKVEPEPHTVKCDYYF